MFTYMYIFTFFILIHEAYNLMQLLVKKYIIEHDTFRSIYIIS